jgi:hypothetical protein
MGGEILVPIPGRGQSILIRDLDNPGNQKIASDAEIEELRTTRLGMNDMRSWAVKEIARVLALDFTPEVFWVYFPKGIEEELARKERVPAQKLMCAARRPTRCTGGPGD